ncbi:MAG: glycosyltransferase [Treponema sp.]|nr:glycosyltransferase [Treponema sp.]
MSLLSIIIPCYNSEHFISQTLNMLISQDLRDCEVIVVNDGSTDRTSQIAHDYENKIPCLKVIDKLNEGVSVARNTGVEHASGRYVYFLDSDDTLAIGTLEFYRKQLMGHTEIPFFAFGYKSVKDGKKVRNFSFSKYDSKVLENKRLKKIFLTKRISFHICSCIFERNFLIKNDIRFTEGQKICEDVCFLLKVIAFTNSCFYLSRICFLYQLRDDSAMQGYSNVYNYDRYKVLDYFFSICKLYFDSKGVREYAMFFLQNALLKNIYRYLRSDYFDYQITSNLIEKCDWFKQRIAFGNFLNYVGINFGKVFPLKKILELKKGENYK